MFGKSAKTRSPPVGRLGRSLGEMRRAHLLVHGALGDFLPQQRRGVEFPVEFELPVGLRDLVQAAGMPHVEVGRITVDGEPAGWSLLIDDGSRIEAHPRYPLADPPPGTRFLLDAHLGKLAGYLRLVGSDAHYDPALDDPQLVERSLEEDRVLLTRDRALLMHGSLRNGSYVRSIDPLRQAVEVVDRFALRNRLLPFTRCMACNAVLMAAGPEAVGGKVPTGVLERYREFHRCPGCGRVYWRGSHHRRLVRLVERIAAGDAG